LAVQAIPINIAVFSASNLNFYMKYCRSLCHSHLYPNPIIKSISSALDAVEIRNDNALSKLCSLTYLLKLLAFLRMCIFVQIKLNIEVTCVSR